MTANTIFIQSTRGRGAVGAGRRPRHLAQATPDPTRSTTVTTPKPTVLPTRYEVSCLPEDDINAHSYAITVEYRGRGLWAVLDGRFCLGTDGDWDWEASPSGREDEWLATHRFDLDTALRLAQEAAPGKTVNGISVADLLARKAAR